MYILFQYRITKYDPAFRIDGKYTKDEWTSIHDIGKIYNGCIFTQDEYEQTEQNHIDCLLALLALSGVNSLCIQKPEADVKTLWRENQIVDLAQLPFVIRDCLREKYWCQLYHAKACIHFGYDYYVYFGSDVPYEQCVEICSQYGLFCEQIISPYSGTVC